MSIKKMLNKLIVISIVVFSFSFAQSRAFVTFDYMKVEPANVAEYIKLESEVWKPVHKEFQKRGIEVSWSLYSVRGAGTQNHYNYVTVSVYDGLGSLDNDQSLFNEIISDVYSNEELEGFWNRTSEARSHNGQDIFFVNDKVSKGNNNELSAFSSGKIGQDITVTFMQTLAGQDAVGLESKWWKSIHRERIKRRVINSWEVLTKRFVSLGQTKLEHDYVTWENYTTFSTIDDSYNSDTFTRAVEKAHPDVDFSEVNEATVKSRNFLRSEIWELVDHLN
jgi:L-rhamnose mutarotase/sRNA-binding carbon storage regulator CsrA